MKTKFITYGFEYNPKKWREIRNHKFFNKPNGGLWGSPIDSSWGWKDWCDSENFKRNDGFNSGFTWEISDPDKILIIDSMETYQSLPESYKYSSSLFGYRTNYIYLDFERISQDYDAILLTERGFNELRHDISLNFCFWDCESIIVLNQEAIINIESITKTLNKD